MNSTETIRILVVEDAPGDVFLIKFYLEELDPDFYELQSVDNLKEAHQMLEREAFDVILLDLNLPDSEGMITLINTVEKFPDSVIIVLTGLSDQSVGLEAVKNGAEDFLVKGRIDSKTLDSSIKFSYQRAKLKKTVKLFGEAIKALENIYDFGVLIIDLSDYTVYHSKRVISFLEIEDGSTMDHISDIYKLFGSEDLINEAVEGCADGVKDLELVNNGVAFKLKFSQADQKGEVVVISVVKQ